MYVLIVGNRGGTNIGECFEKAATRLGASVGFMESQKAMQAPGWLRHFNWHFRGHRPTKLRRFNNELVEQCSARKPNILIATGQAPITRNTLGRLRSMGIIAVNYLTDDPWNRSHRADWFIAALPLYNFVFSPRRSNLADLRACGCRLVSYLPFAYDPELHFPEATDSIRKAEMNSADVLFVGGADQDRVPYCHSLAQQGFSMSLYGSYWDRYEVTCPYWRGYGDPRTIRVSTAFAKICLLLVRRANRDGHTMRSLEAPAIGGCLLVEDTDEHRELFGDDCTVVVYFRSIPELTERAQWLLRHPDERRRLATAAHLLITQGANTYADRLCTILEFAT